jgi:hypothetical protein
MKRCIIAVAAVLVVLVVAWTAFAQAEEGATQRQSMRERFQNMSEAEREKFRAEMRERGGSGRGGFMSPEDQQEAIKTIEGQLAKLKAGTQAPRPEGGFQDLSEDERAKLREQMTKVRQEREAALQTIIAQVARLQGRRGPAPEGAQYMIISAAQLKPIQDSAVKEKATETAQLIERLMTRGSGRRGPGGGRPPGSGQRPEGGQRGTRGSGAGGGGGSAR